MASENQALTSELFAEEALQCIKNRNTESLIQIIKDLNQCDERQAIKHQKFAEYCLQEVLFILTNEPEISSFICLVWNVLNTVSPSAIVRRTIWKDTSIVFALYKSMKFSLVNHHKKLQKVCTNFLSLMLVGAPNSFFHQVGETPIIVVLLDIIKTENYAEETFKSVICCFGLLCDGTDLCKQQLIELNVADAVLNMGEKHALEDEDFSNLAALTYDDLSILKMDGSIGRQKFLKGQVDSILYCSNPPCLKPQRDTKYKKCSRCKMTFYCTKECQVQHWKSVHHRFCLGKSK